MLTWHQQEIQKRWKQPWWLISIRAVGLLASLWKKQNSSPPLSPYAEPPDSQLLVNNPHSPPTLLPTRAPVGPSLESLPHPSVSLSTPVLSIVSYWLQLYKPNCSWQVHPSFVLFRTVMAIWGLCASIGTLESVCQVLLWILLVFGLDFLWTYRLGGHLHFIMLKLSVHEHDISGHPSHLLLCLSKTFPCENLKG